MRFSSQPARAIPTVVRVLLIVLVTGLPPAPSWLWTPMQNAWAAGRSSKSKPKSKKDTRDFEYTLSDCLASGEKGSMQLVLGDAWVGFNQILTLNCGIATRPGSAKVSYVKRGRNLEVSVALPSHAQADCECPIAFDGKISNLQPGGYHLSFVLDLDPGQANTKQRERHVLGTQEFTIK